MKKILTIILCSALVMISGCDKYDFDQEQFRKEVNLLSNSNLVYDRQVAELQQGGDTLFVVASLSGSQATDEPVTVVLQHSDTLLRAYNKSNFDINKARFAKYLPEECYEFPTMEMNISAGSSKAMFPVYLKNLEKISPDSIYFLEYKIDSLRTPDCNPKRGTCCFVSTRRITMRPRRRQLTTITPVVRSLSRIRMGIVKFAVRPIPTVYFLSLRTLYV